MQPLFFLSLDIHMITIRRMNAAALGAGAVLLYLNLRAPGYLGFDWPLVSLWQARSRAAKDVAQEKAKELAPELASALCHLPPVSALQETMAAPYVATGDTSGAARILGEGCEVIPGVVRWPKRRGPDLELAVPVVDQ